MRSKSHFCLLLGALLWCQGQLLAGPVGVFDNAQDIGAPGAAGSTTVAASTYTLKGAGDDIWDNGDHFHFAYKYVRGDFTLTVRLTRRDRTPVGSGQWGRHGLMARWTTGADSKYSFIGTVIPTEEAPGAWHPPLYQYRMLHQQPATSRLSYWADTRLFPAEGRLPTWMRMVRIGSAIYGYLAEDANHDNQPDRWILVGSDASPYTPEDLLVGVASHAQSGANLATIAFDNVSYVVNDQQPLPECAAGQVFAEVNYDSADLRLPAGTTGSLAAIARSGPLAPYTHQGKLVVANAFNLQSANMLWYLLNGSEQMSSRGFVAEFDAFMGLNPFENSAADGMTFSVVQAASSVFAAGIPATFGGGDGGALGYGNGDLKELVEECPSFAVELDNWVGGGEPSNEPPDGGWPAGVGRYHVGLDVNGEVSSIQTNVDRGVPTNLLPDIFAPAGVRVKVLYSPAGQVDVWVRSNTAPFTEYQVISARIPPLVGPLLFGFTAGTGGAGTHFLVDNLKISLLNCSAQPPETLAPRVIDLGNVTGGGDGLITTPMPYIGVDPRTGRFATQYIYALVTEFDVGFSDGKNPSPGDGPYIDSVFFNTNRQSGEFFFPQDITQSGVKYLFPLHDTTAGVGFNHILANRIGGLSNPGIIIGPHTGYTTAVGMHSSVGITYDLDALRATHGWRNVQVFHTVAGLDNCVGGEVDLIILLAGASGVMVEKIIHVTTGGYEVVTLPIPSSARYLTLSTGNYGSDLNCDHGTFARANITAGPTTRQELLWLWDAQPRLVSAGGGQAVQITGEYLGPGPQYTYLVGGKLFSNPSFVSPTLVRGALPSLPVGFHDVEVIATSGNPAISGVVRARLRNAIEVAPPVEITAVEPNRVFADTANLITIRGRNFRLGTTKFEVKGPTGDVFVVGPLEASDTRITGMVPAQSAGAKDVVASDVRGSSVLARGLTFVDPTIIALTSAAPGQISTAGGTLVTFRGRNFIDGLVVPRLGGKDLTEVVFVSSTELRGKSPALTAGRHAAQLTRPGGSLLASLPNAIEAVPAVTITQVVPRDMHSDRSTRVLIRGTNFRPGITRIRVGSQDLADSFLEADGKSILGRVPPMPLAETLGPRDVFALDPIGDFRLPAGARYIAPPAPTDLPPGPLEVEGNLAQGTARFYWFNPVDYAQILVRSETSAPLRTLGGDESFVELPAPGAQRLKILLIGVLSNGDHSSISSGLATINACERPAPLTGNDAPGAGSLSIYGGSADTSPARCAAGGGGVLAAEDPPQGHGAVLIPNTKGFVTPASRRALAGLNPSKLITGFTLDQDADKLEIAAFYQKLATELGLSLRGRIKQVSGGSFLDEFTFPDVLINPSEKEWNSITYFRAQGDVGGATLPARCPGNLKIPRGEYLLEIYAVGGDPNFPYYVFQDDGRSEELLIAGVPCPPYPRVRISDVTGFVTLPSFGENAFEVTDVRRVDNGLRLRITAQGSWDDADGETHSLDPIDRTYSDNNFEFVWALHTHEPPAFTTSTTHTVEVVVPDYGCYQLDLYVNDRACGFSKRHSVEIAIRPDVPPCGNAPYNFSYLTPDPSSIWAIAGLNPAPGRGVFNGTRPLNFRVLVTPCPCGATGAQPCESPQYSALRKDVEFRLAVRLPTGDVGIQAMGVEDPCPNLTSGAKFFLVTLEDIGKVPVFPGNDGHRFSDIYLQGRKTAGNDVWRDISSPFKMANRPPSLANSKWSGRFVGEDQSYHFTTQSSEKSAQLFDMKPSEPLKIPLPGVNLTLPEYDNGVSSGLNAAFMVSKGLWIAKEAVGTLGGQVMGNQMDGEPSVLKPTTTGGGGGLADEGGGGVVTLPDLPSYEWCDERTLLHNEFSQTLFQSILFSGPVFPAVYVTVWASVQLGIEVTVKSYMKFKATPFKALLQGGNFVQSDFLLTTRVDVRIPCQIRADILFGIASIAARLIPEASGDLKVHLGVRDTKLSAASDLKVLLSLYFQVKACLVGFCATILEADIFRNEELASASFYEPSPYRIPEPSELRDCDDGSGGGGELLEPEEYSPAAPDGGGGRDIDYKVFQVVSAPVTEATRDGSNVLDVWFDEAGKPVLRMNGSREDVRLPTYYNVTGSFNDPSAGFIRNDLAIIAWTSDRYAAHSGVDPSRFGNLSYQEQSAVESQREIVISVVKRVPTPAWEVELPFSISDLVDPGPSPLPLDQRRADGRPSLAADPLHQSALVAWVRYETANVFAQDPGDETSYYAPTPQANGKPGFKLVQNVPRVRAQLDQTAVYVRRLDFTPGATTIGEMRRISALNSGINLEPALAVSPTGNTAYCVWVHDPDHQDLVTSNKGRFLVYSKYTRSTGNWTAPLPVVPNPDDFPGILHPDIALLDDQSGLISFTALDKKDCLGTSAECERESGLTGSGRYVYTCRLANGVFGAPVQIHGQCQERMVGVWSRIRLPTIHQVVDPVSRHVIINPALVIIAQGTGPQGSRAGAGNVIVAAMGKDMAQPSQVLTLTNDDNGHMNVTGSIQGGMLRTVNLNLGPSLLSVGVGGGGGVPDPAGYEVIETPLHPDLAIIECKLADQFPGPGVTVPARVTIENLGLASSPQTAGGESVVGVQAVFLAADGSEEIVATAPIAVTAPGGRVEIELELEMPHDPVRLRVELNPNPVDRDRSNDSRECFFGAPAPRNVLCQPTTLADQAASTAVLITWENPALYDQIILYRDGAMLTVIQGSATSFVDAQSEPLSHTYIVRGCIGASKSIRAETACEIVEPPGPSFLRGDADASGVIDISDPIFTLSFLFIGGPAPSCRKAADTDDSGQLDISDAIRTLAYLFSGGTSPPAPHPACGLDPSPDALQCEQQPRCR